MTYPSDPVSARRRLHRGAAFNYVDADGFHHLLVEDILPDGQVRFRLEDEEDFQWVGIRDAIELIATGIWQ